MVIIATGCNFLDKKIDDRIKYYFSTKWRVSYYESGAIKDSIAYITDSLVFDGDFKTYYPSGQIEYWRFYKNGKQENKEIAYYENGNIAYFVEYKNDKRHGYDISYYENKNVKILDSFYNGHKIGESYLFDSTGNLLQKGSVQDLPIIGK